MIDFIHTGTYTNPAFWIPTMLRNRKVIQQSRRTSVVDAAYSMAILNRFAKGALEPVKNDIYYLKQHMTKYLYTHYPTDVRLLKQTLKCHSCDGTGTYTRRSWDGDILWEDYCNHCGGTGIYNTIEILAFTFHIGKETVSWHQPRNLVTFDAFIPCDVGVYEGEKPARYSRSQSGEFLLDYLTVREFLVQENMIEGRVCLWRGLRVDLSRLRHTLPYLFRQQWNKFVDWLIGDRMYQYGELYWFNDDYDDPLPDDEFDDDNFNDDNEIPF
jgi:hypothetical protein